MKFSPQQAKALTRVSDFMKSKKQVFYLAGYAGTGKTTLAKYFANGLDTLSAAYTGKAALCLRKAGLPKASTIHAILYKPVYTKVSDIKDLEKLIASGKGTSDIRRELAELKEIKFTLRQDSPIQDVDLLILDECSMINEEMAKDILSFGTKVLVLGDPMQLPPIKGTGFFTEKTPDVLLTEIHRQALENPIIALSKHVRENGNVPVNFADNAKRISKQNFMREIYELVTSKKAKNMQVLTGKNKTRRALNEKIRDYLGFFSEYPEVSDKLICLKNNRDLEIFNGMFAEVTKIHGLKENFAYQVDLKTELDNKLENFNIFSAIFEGEIIQKQVPYFIQKQREHFDYGYCITVHKSQGSQFDHVYIADDGFLTWSPEDRRRWLYTAVTRAVESVFVA